MGRTVAARAGADESFILVGGIERAESVQESDGYPSLVTPDNVGSLLADADVLVDFSAPPFLRSVLEGGRDSLRGKGIAVGTTGLGEAEQQLLHETAKVAAVLTATNFSLGVNLLLGFAEQAAAALGPGFDVEIVETHHRRKEDAPSGTALSLGEAVARGRGIELSSARRDGRSGRPGARPDGEIAFHALRGGDVVGEHQVNFIGTMERIELVHRAADRALFAAGALRAAQWLAGRAPGRYTMRDVLGI